MASSKIPPERLNQIAQRKLNAMQVATRTVDTPHGQRLEGELHLADGALRDPFSQASITYALFTVQGHDQLLFLKPPPLVALGPVPFFDHAEMYQVLAQVQRQLEQRAAALEQQQRRCQRLGLACRVDTSKLSIQAKVKLAQAELLLEGDGRQLSIVQLRRPGQAQAVAVEPVPLSLDEYADRIDLELALDGLASSLQEKKIAAAAAEPVTAPSPSATADESKQPEGLPLGEVVARLGQDCLLTRGAILAKDLQVGARKLRLALRLEEGNQLAVRLLAPSGEIVWRGRVELERLVSAEDFVVGLTAEASVQSQRGGGTAATPVPAASRVPVDFELAAGQALPVAGERWVMNVLVERDDGNEIRYVGINADGQPFGAQRVLPKAVFTTVFVRASPGVYRLLVEVVAVKQGTVHYFQLDAANQRRDSTRSCDLPTFMSNFLPEAMLF